MPRPSKYDQNSDHAESVNWAIRNCGTSNFVIMCHSDMIFTQDIISEFAKEIKCPELGAYGIQNHCYVINRDAFNRVHTRMNAIGNWWVVPVANGLYKLKHGSDVEALKTPGKIQLNGFDTSELLILMMWAHAWYTDLDENNRLKPFVDHMCSGHGYTSDDVNASHVGRREAWRNTWGVPVL